MIFFLACRKFDGSHTGAAIGSKLLEIFTEFGIKDKAFHCITDSAGNMIKGWSVPWQFMSSLILYLSGLRDLNDLRANAGSDTATSEEDLELPDTDLSTQDEITLIERGLQELEVELDLMGMGEQCGVHCESTTRMPCIAHKVSGFL